VWGAVWVNPSAPPAAGIEEEDRMTTLKVDGMTCQHCVMAVKKALESVEGVSGAEVDLASGSAQVQGKADIQDLLAAVREEGYEAAPRAA
jgi:copper chaperone